jgi:hypothetical protein
VQQPQQAFAQQQYQNQYPPQQGPGFNGPF